MTQPWYPFYWKDYSGKTLHLTVQQHGVYFLCMRYIYTTGRPIPHKDRYRVAQATLEAEQADCDRVLDEFFERDGDKWSNSKVSEVIQRANERHQQFVDAGKLGAKVKQEYLKGGLSEASSLPSSLGSATTTTTTLSDSVLSSSLADPSKNDFEASGNKLNGHSGINGNGKWSDPSNRNNFAIQACIPFLPGGDDGERWAIAVAAEDQKSPKYTEACRAMRLAAGKAKVGWVSPHRRKE